MKQTKNIDELEGIEAIYQKYFMEDSGLEIY